MLRFRGGLKGGGRQTSVCLHKWTSERCPPPLGSPFMVNLLCGAQPPSAAPQLSYFQQVENMKVYPFAVPLALLTLSQAFLCT